jgi:hypothetical protein
MKHSSKALQLLTGTIVALIVLAATIVAAPTKASTAASLHARTTALTVTSDQHSHATLDLLHSNSILEEDHFALRTGHFSIPQPTLYAIATHAGYGPAIRRTRIRRKGNLRG